MTIFGFRPRRSDLPLAVMTVALLACIEWECSPLGIVIVAASWLGSAIIAAAAESIVPKIRRWRFELHLVKSIGRHPSASSKRSVA